MMLLFGVGVSLLLTVPPEEERGVGLRDADVDCTDPVFTMGRGVVRLVPDWVPAVVVGVGLIELDAALAPDGFGVWSSFAGVTVDPAVDDGAGVGLRLALEPLDVVVDRAGV
jgi:hypothetical protein